MKSIDLSEEHKYDVTLHHVDIGDLGAGVLTFGANKWAHVAFRDWTKAQKLGEGKTWPIIKAKTNDGETISLFDCKVTAYAFHADYVVVGDVDLGEFQRIDIRYSDISEWFSNWQHIEGTVGDKLTWVNRSKPLSVNVVSEHVAIRTNFVGSCEQSGEDHIVHEHLEFIVEKTSGAFSLIDLQRTTLEISCLFSILIAHPISLVSVSVMAKDGYLYQVYFPGFKKVEQKLSDNGFITRCLVQKRAIEDRWQTIFESYYKSEFRKVIWIRLSGMQRYDGFWEYRTLGYVSLLDQYVSQAAKGKKKPAAINSKKLSKLQGAIDKVSPALSGKQRNQLVNIASPALCKDQRELTFPERYDLALKNTDADITKIIDLSAEAFKAIKDVRDAIAHGDDPGIPGKDFTRVSVIVSKIELLLTYWAFVDFGLTKDDFLKCLTSTHSRLRLVSQVNDVHIARVMKTAEFFKASEAKLQEWSKKKNIEVYACFVQAANGEIEYSDHYTKIHWKWFRDTSQKKVSPYSPADIFGLKKDSIRCVPTAYIESGAAALRLNSMYLLDASQLPST